MHRVLLLLLVAAGIGNTSCDGSPEKKELDDPARQTKLRSKYSRELRLCEAIGEQQSPLCLQALAIMKREPFLCSEIPETSGWRGECYRKVASLTGESVLCNRIGSPALQARCHAAAAAVRRDPSDCERIRIADKERKKAESALPAIEVGNSEWSVDANYNACVAVAKRDAEGCEAIDAVNDSDARRLCFQELALARADPSLCSRLKTGGTSIFVYDCIREVGIRSSLTTVCDQIPGDEGSSAYRHLDDCRRSVELFKRTGVRCEERDPLCTGRIAAATRDLTLCRKLRSYTEIDNCLVTYAYKTGHATVCGEMRNGSARSICQELARTAESKAPAPAPEVSKGGPPSPDGRPAARLLQETTAKARRDATIYWSRFLFDNLARIERRSEERMRLDLLKGGASESSPADLLIRLRSTEILLKMRWCNEGEVGECIGIGEELFRNCQFNQAQDAFLRAKAHLDKMPRELDGHIFEGDARQKVESGVSMTDPSRRRGSCATYGLRCCGSADPEEAALWEGLWRNYRSHANVAFSGLSVMEGSERLLLGIMRGILLRKHHEFVHDFESLDMEAAKPAREALMLALERFCSGGDSMSCRILTEANLAVCRFKEAEGAHRRMMAARAAELAVLKRIKESGEVVESLRKALEEMPRAFANPAIFSEERRILCEQLRGSTRR